MEIKKINRFLPVLLIMYVVLGNVLYYVIHSSGLNVPEWVDYVLSEAVNLIVVLIFLAIMRINIFKSMPFRKLKPGDVGLSILTGYLLIPVVTFLNTVSMLFFRNHMQESSQSLFEMPFIEQLILVAVIPALVEEFIFRGLFFTTYRKNGLIGAAAMSGLVFGLFHLNINQFCYAVVLGFVFSVMVEATGSLWSSVCAHFAVNTYSITMIMMLKLTGMYDKIMGMQEESAASASEIPVVAQIVSVVIQIGTLAFMAIAFMLLAWLCIRKMAKRNGRLEPFMMYLKQRMPKGSWKSFISIPAVATIVMCIVFMIYIEFA